MFPRTLTSLNCVFAITIAGLYDAPQILDHFAADNSFAVDAITVSESRIGVDGFHSAGLVKSLIPMKIYFEGDSPSADIFDQWVQAQNEQGDLFFATVNITVPGLNKSYTLNKGVLSKYKPLPDMKKVAGGLEYDLTFESISNSLE